ncbi:RNA-dependent RNA polymerase [Colletotrichum gloeosporioides ourmia-like virus 1]|uniref:RNA-dependent RNA polymerase n=1 Tax=Colletotrichum gloeosporioides ourmia-like virus 1 TaxID=2599960 RepID=A0A5B8GNW6_9VIRU|nr:RNA-dependent RNA polymerase [Colletotrichum gloeosporioides ourmia-like virus 1]QDW80875.1 RNA-dependent RNA polymerase [Colletotrichum gloeosporioides ourmia-like virus 1]UOV22973.1 RNA-dependent RNA polymerase [Colletotrichum fructicola ourmia-like virus 1]
MGQKRSDHVKTPAFWSATCSVRRRFLRLKRALEKLHQVSLPSPMLVGTAESKEKNFKRFLSDLIEGKEHIWVNPLRRLQRRTRYSIGLTLFLFRKILKGKSPDLESLLERVSSPPGEVDNDFLEFARDQVDRIFPQGWDRGYWNRVKSATVSTKSCSESRRSDGGNRMYWLDRANSDARSEFCQYLSGERDLRDLPDTAAQFINVETSGKVRALSVPPAKFSLLLPLHKLMYDQLSKEPWLLRGDASAKSFSDFLKQEGELFVSGDYESATDNLNPIIQHEILSKLLSNCTEVPSGISQLALRSLHWRAGVRGNIDASDEEHPPDIREITSGQMMGFPISFPLLCLINYITFKFAVRRHVPLRINGDDIVARITKEEYDRWVTLVGKSGLKLSVGKTMVDRSFFTLNSSLFEGKKVRVVELPFIRSKAFFGLTEEDKEGSPYSFVGRYKSFCPGYFGQKRWYLRTLFLQGNRDQIMKSGGSLNRRFQMNIPAWVLRDSQLLSREASFLDLPAEKPPPMEKSEWSKRPKGFRIAYSASKKEYSEEEKEELIEAQVQSAWEGPDEDEDYRQVFEGLKDVSFNLIKMSKMLRLPVGELRKTLRARAEKIVSSYKRPAKVYPYWKKSEGSCHASLACQEEQDQQVVEPRLYPPPLVY